MIMRGFFPAACSGVFLCFFSEDSDLGIFLDAPKNDTQVDALANPVEIRPAEFLNKRPADLQHLEDTV